MITKRHDENKLSSRSTGSVTLDDVARVAGVSPITVSRAINRPDIVAQHTLESVRLAIERTGYVPNMLAGGLASKSSKMIAAVIPTLENSVFAETVQALTDSLWDAGYQLLLGTTGYPPQREETLLSAILSRRPDAMCLTGVIHTPGAQRKLLAANIPIVEMWDMSNNPMDMIVGFSHENIGISIGEYLCQKGYRKFAFISGNDERGILRLKGFLKAVQKYGIMEKDVDLAFVKVPSNLHRGREGLAQLLDSGKKPDAVFCNTDLLAHGAMLEAEARGIRIPQDMAFVGFGDLDFAAYTDPPLTTVYVDRPGIGHMTANLLLDRINGKSIDNKIIDVGHKIVERGSA